MDCTPPPHHLQAKTPLMDAGRRQRSTAVLGEEQQMKTNSLTAGAVALLAPLGVTASAQAQQSSKGARNRSIPRLSRRVVMTVLGALSLVAASMTVAAAPASAKPTTPVPVCAGAKDLLVDVTQDVRNQPFLPARDGHMWANFTYTQHLRIGAVGARQYCVRKDFDGTWTSIAGLS